MRPRKGRDAQLFRICPGTRGCGAGHLAPSCSRHRSPGPCPAGAAATRHTARIVLTSLWPPGSVSEGPVAPAGLSPRALRSGRDRHCRPCPGQASVLARAVPPLPTPPAASRFTSRVETQAPAWRRWCGRPGLCVSQQLSRTRSPRRAPSLPHLQSSPGPARAVSASHSTDEQTEAPRAQCD